MATLFHFKRKEWPFCFRENLGLRTCIKASSQLYFRCQSECLDNLGEEILFGNPWGDHDIPEFYGTMIALNH